ncbi:MAG TPA: glucosamine-6-phosphate deaminase [Spirochaetota bacterium]|nr:glucosamine-6-phosphate deaminase [Spirochaetota bacterium]
MDKIICSDNNELGQKAGNQAARFLKQTLQEQGQAAVILATGASQLQTLSCLTAAPDIDWSRVTMFHLDEYLNLSPSHAASFCKYLRENFINKVSPLADYYLIDSSNDPHAECSRLNRIIQKYTIDLALIGIGENAHLAFNDPPADFTTDSPYIIVDLAQACRQQQVNEKWFNTLAEVPRQAISMSVRHILKSKKLIVSIPGKRKAQAVKDTCNQPVNNKIPATILQQHPDCTLFLDRDSAAGLK